jgi:hypothetical protein
MQEPGDVVVGGGRTERPEETGCYFVADRDDGERNFVACEAVGDGKGIVINFPGEITNIRRPS